jgi:hypothetical protein
MGNNMSKQDIVVEELPLTNKPNSFLEISVFYSKGDSSYSSSDRRRGYWVLVTPIEREKSETPGVTFRVCMLFSGIRSLIEETKRFSDKRLKEIANKVKSRDIQIQYLIDRVLEKNHLTLVTPPVAAPIEQSHEQQVANPS